MRKLFFLIILFIPAVVAHAEFGQGKFGDVPTLTAAQARSSTGWTGNGGFIYQTTLTDNVGINTITPGASLTILKSSTEDMFHVNSTAAAGGNVFAIKNSGNVGIGTALPAVNTDIFGLAPILRLTDSQNLAGTAWAGVGIGSLEFYSTDPSGSSKRVIDAIKSIGSNDSSGGANGGDLVFFTSANNSPTLSERMRITDNGNVGLGTSLSTNKLDISAGVAVGTAYAGYQTAPTNGLIVQGNVGIGTWVSSTAWATIDAVSTENQLTFRRAGSVTNQINANNTQFTNNISASGAFNIISSGVFGVGIGTTLASGNAGLSIMNGNVGIGTWIPGVKLDVVGGNIRSSSSVQAAFIQAPTIRGSGSFNNITLNTADGNVGIGTTVPNGLLSLGVGTLLTQWGSPIPVLSSCGGSPSIKGTDQAGEITVGSAATGCTITFGRSTYQDASCLITNQSMSVVNAMTYTVSATAITVSQTALSAAKLNYRCDFKN